MNTTTIVGLIACLLTTGAFLPQIIKTIRTKDTKSISLTMYIAYSAGICLWILYGCLLKNEIMIFANIIALLLGILMIVLKIKYRNSN